MKKQNILAAAILLAATGVSTTASAVPFVADYEEATSAYEDAYLFGSFSANGGRVDIDGNESQSNYDLDLDIEYDKVFSSPNRNTAIEFDGSGTAFKSGELNTESSTDYNAGASITVDNYFNPSRSKTFWYGRGELGALKGAESIFSAATVGLGYGRVVNVTPLARSIRIIEDLLEKGYLKSDPSNAIYQQVAKIIEKEDEYESKHGNEDYEQYWVQDIQAAIQASGAANGPLNARAILSSYDVLTTETISTRKDGWLVRAGVGAVITDFDGDDGKPTLEVGAEYHKPFSNKLQFSNEALFSAVVQDDDDSFRVDNNMSLTYEVSDTIDWVNSWDLDYLDFGNDVDSTTNTFTSGFNYKIANQLDFNAFARVIDYDELDNDESLNMGLTYRLK